MVLYKVYRNPVPILQSLGTELLRLIGQRKYREKSAADGPSPQTLVERDSRDGVVHGHGHTARSTHQVCHYSNLDP